MLIGRFGGVMGNWIMAGGLAGLGILAAVAVKMSEASEETTEETSAGTRVCRAPSGILPAAPAAVHLLSAARGPMLRTAALAWRHAPVLMLAGLVSLLFYPTPPDRRARLPVRVKEPEKKDAPASDSLAIRHAAQMLLAGHEG